MEANQFKDNQNKEIKTPVLKVRGKTLIFENSVYQISNISSVSLVDLSSVKEMPSYFLWMLIIGVVLLVIPMNQLRVLGFIILAVLIWRFFEYRKSKLTERYGIGIFLNSGMRTILISKNYEFMKEVVLVLNNIMNTDELKAINFNLDQNQIYEDRSINIKEMTGSNVITGSVKGNIASSV